MQYLKNYTKDELAGISHASYRKDCTSKGIEYNSNAGTLYLYSIIQHPVTNEYALAIDNTDCLSDVFYPMLISHEQMELDGWFDYPPIS